MTMKKKIAPPLIRTCYGASLLKILLCLSTITATQSVDSGELPSCVCGTFSIPIRTFIVTLDRLVEGIRSARKVKKASQRTLFSSDRNVQSKYWLRRINFDRAGDVLLALINGRLNRTSYSTSIKKPKIKSFFSRFIDGYLQAERDEAKKERLTTAIQDFFGRQGI